MNVTPVVLSCACREVTLLLPPEGENVAATTADSDGTADDATAAGSTSDDGDGASVEFTKRVDVPHEDPDEIEFNLRGETQEHDMCLPVIHARVIQTDETREGGRTKLLRFHNVDWDEKWVALSDAVFEEEVDAGPNPAWREEPKSAAADAVSAKSDGDEDDTPAALKVARRLRKLITRKRLVVKIDYEGKEMQCEYRVAPLTISYFKLLDGRGWISSFYDYHPQAR